MKFSINRLIRMKIVYATWPLRRLAALPLSGKLARWLTAPSLASGPTIPKARALCV